MFALVTISSNPATVCQVGPGLELLICRKLGIKRAVGNCSEGSLEAGAPHGMDIVGEFNS